MTTESAYRCAPHRLAVLTAGLTFLLIVAGGFVTSTGSGLAEHDWPQITGMTGTKFYEGLHRLIGATVGLLTLVLALWLILQEPRRGVRWCGIAALASVSAQGLLGALTVRLKLPPSVSIFHAALAEFTFCLLVALAVFTSREWLSPPMSASTLSPRFSRRALMATVMIYLQIILGAWRRHTDSDIALGIHILWALGVGGHIVMVTTSFLSEQKGDARGRLLAQALVLLFVLQLILGPLAIMLAEGKAALDQPRAFLPSALVTAHLAAGALLLACGLIIALRAYREQGVTAPTSP